MRMFPISIRADWSICDRMVVEPTSRFMMMSANASALSLGNSKSTLPRASPLISR